MEGIRSIVSRFPQREFEIRRCYMRDAQFRAICADYEEALRALRHWQGASEKGDAEGARKATDYKNLAAELEQEVFAYLA